MELRMPRILLTRFDYEYIKEEKIQGWEKKWQELLDHRFSWFLLEDGENPGGNETKIITGLRDGKEIKITLVHKEDPTSKIFRLGLTVDEVEAALRNDILHS